jgi:endonuclease YncB( thermonuclease family)
VIDGDTVRSGGHVYRLVGYNTSESGDNAGCSRERILAADATGRLRQLVANGETGLERVPCACQPGTEGTKDCNHGRRCGRLTVDGKDVGRILIAEGLAERYACWQTSCPRRKNWCAS